MLPTANAIINSLQVLLMKLVLELKKGYFYPTQKAGLFLLYHYFIKTYRLTTLANRLLFDITRPEKLHIFENTTRESLFT